MRVAIHEAGHTLANYHINDIDSIARVSVAKQNYIDGYIRLINRKKDTHTEHELKNKVVTSLAGYAAELCFYHEVSAGASSDIAVATRIAEDMVYECGMSALGPRKFRSREDHMSNEFSNTLQKALEDETGKIINQAFEEAKRIVAMNKDKIEIIANHLAEKKVLSTLELKQLITEH